MDVRFRWNPRKAEANLRKHGVSFDDALRVFSDPLAIHQQDRVEGGEYRWQIMGFADAVTLLVVAYTTWDDDLGEVIRIISARPATRPERKRYEQDT